MTVDRAAIAADLWNRQRLRRAAQLPPLDIKREYEFEVALAQQNEFQDFAKEHESERQRVRDEVMAYFAQKHGSQFRYSTNGITAINRETNRRFCAYLYQEFGIPVPKVVSRNAAVYDSGSDETG